MEAIFFVRRSSLVARDFSEYKVINRPKPIANNSTNLLRGVVISNSSKFTFSNLRIDQVDADSPPVNILMPRINVIIEMISVSALDADFNLFGKNSSTKPTISGKKTGIYRMFISNLEILQL